MAGTPNGNASSGVPPVNEDQVNIHLLQVIEELERALNQKEPEEEQEMDVEEAVEGTEDTSERQKVFDEIEAACDRLQELDMEEFILSHLMELSSEEIRRVPLDLPETNDVLQSASSSLPSTSTFAPDALDSVRDILQSLAPKLLAEQQGDLGWALLMAIDSHREPDVIRRLLNAGADVNFVGWGYSALMVAITHRDLTIAEMLLCGGATVNTQTERRESALHFAALDDYSGRCVSLLLQAQADIESTSVLGRTPLHCAAASENLAAVKILLEAGANRDARDIDNERPYDKTRSELIRYLFQ